jgi:hypothetical protein
MVLVVEFVDKNAVSREGFRGVFAVNTTKAKPSTKLIIPRRWSSIPLSSVLKATRRGADLKRRR